MLVNFSEDTEGNVIQFEPFECDCHAKNKTKDKKEKRL